MRGRGPPWRPRCEKTGPANFLRLKCNHDRKRHRIDTGPALLKARADAIRSATQPGYQPLVVVAIAVSAGVALDRYFPARLFVWWIAAAVMWCAWLAAWRARRKARAGAWMLVSLAATGAAWHQAQWSLYAADELGTFARDAAQPVCVEAIARTSPRRVPAPEFDPLRPIGTGDRSRLAVRLVGIRDGEAWTSASGLTTLDVEGHLLGVHAGDRLQIFAQLRQQRAGESWRVRFCGIPASRSAALPPGDRPSRMRHANRPRLGMASAPLAGSRPALGRQRPVVVIEPRTVGPGFGPDPGAARAARCCRHAPFLRYRHRSSAFHFRLACGVIGARALSWVGAGLLAARTGAGGRGSHHDFVRPGDRCRASGRARHRDGAFRVRGMYAGRPMTMFNLLGAAALVVIMMNPAELFRTGTQLSFLAVATMAWIGPRLWKSTPLDPLDRLIARSRPWPQRRLAELSSSLGRVMLMTTAIWFVSLPLVLARFNLISPASLLLTPLLAVPVAIGLFTGFVLVSVGWLIWPLSIPLGIVCDECMKLVTGAVRIVDQLPGSHVWLPGPSWWWLAGCYGLLGLWAVDARWRPRAAGAWRCWPTGRPSGYSRRRFARRRATNWTARFFRSDTAAPPYFLCPMVRRCFTTPGNSARPRRPHVRFPPFSGRAGAGALMPWSFRTPISTITTRCLNCCGASASAPCMSRP